MSVGEFSAEVALIPLVFGNFQINRLVLRNADISIETDAEGRSNLDFTEAVKKETASEGASGLPRINDIVIENSVLTLIDGVRGATTTLDVKRLSAKAANFASPLSVSIAGAATLDGQKIEFTADGDLGAPNFLLASKEPFPIDVQVTALGLTAHIDGVVADVKNTTGVDLNFEVSGPDLQGLAALTGGGLPPVGPVEFTAALKGDAGRAALENIALKIGQSQVAGNVSIDLRGKRPRLDGTLIAEHLNLVELLPAEDTATGAPASVPDKVFPSDPLPFGSLMAFDAKLDLSIAQLLLPGATLSDATGVLALDNGALALNPVNATLVGSAISGNIGIDTRSGPASVSLDLKAPQLDLGELLREAANLDQLRGGGAVDVSLRGTGHSVAAIMASLNGHTRLLMNEGEMKNEFLGTVSGLTQTIGEVFGKKEWIAVECIASDFEVANGIANSRINIINTELLLITTEGKVDLAQEKPDLKVTPHSKGFDLSLAVPVNIGGSLASPTITPDTFATVTKIGGLLSAIAFPPAALIGLTELGGSDNACLQTAQADRTPAEAVSDTAKDAVEGIGEGLKQLFGD